MIGVERYGFIYAVERDLTTQALHCYQLTGEFGHDKGIVFLYIYIYITSDDVALESKEQERERENYSVVLNCLSTVRHVAATLLRGFVLSNLGKH